MSIDNKFERVEPDDPLRCQGIYRNGQCPYKALPGSQFCNMHSGPGQYNKEENEKKRIYRLGQWSARVGEIADHDQVKSLREEVGLLRMILETIVSRCTDTNDLLIYANQISDTVLKTEKLVSSMHRLEAATGMLLDKSTALHLAANIVEIIGRFVTDETVLDSIGTEIVSVIIKSQTAVTKT